MTSIGISRIAQCRQVHPSTLTNNEVLAANTPSPPLIPMSAWSPCPTLAWRSWRLWQGAGRAQASVTFVDIAGIVRGASQGEGLGNKFPAAIRRATPSAGVACFSATTVVHVTGGPESDIGTVNTEPSRRICRRWRTVCPSWPRRPGPIQN
jgi:ribosome-binding ATPase YchF (GTP1/OBG family)